MSTNHLCKSAIWLGLIALGLLAMGAACSATANVPVIELPRAESPAAASSPSTSLPAASALPVKPKAPREPRTLLEVVEAYRAAACGCTTIACTADASKHYAERVKVIGAGSPSDAEAIGKAMTATMDCITNLTLNSLPPGAGGP